MMLSNVTAMSYRRVSWSAVGGGDGGGGGSRSKESLVPEGPGTSDVGADGVTRGCDTLRNHSRYHPRIALTLAP